MSNSEALFPATPQINDLISNIHAIDNSQDELEHFLEDSMDRIIECVSFIF